MALASLGRGWHACKRLFGLTLVLLASGRAMAQDTGATDVVARVLATDGRLDWMGRTAATSTGGRIMAYPGVQLRFRYSGPAPRLRLRAESETCYFNLSINGWSPAVLHLAPGENVIPLPAGPAPATGWEVTLVRRTEAWQGLATLECIEILDAKTKIASPSSGPDRRLLVIGDSITTGHYVEQLPGVPDPTPRTNNAERTWGWLLARSLQAQVNIVAYGGRGLTRAWDGRTDVATAPQFFERVLPDDPASQWEHAAYAPDAIVIMLGQNDFSLGLPEHTAFVEAYLAFLARIQAVHPTAVIVLTGSPMHGTAPGSDDAKKRTALYACLDEAARTHTADTGQIVRVVEVSHQPGTVLDAHPVVFQQEQIAAELEPAVRAACGW